MEVITKRPDNMRYEVYRILRAENKKKIARYLKYGRTYYISWKHTFVEVAGVKQEITQMYPPFIGSVRRDLIKPL